MTYPEAWQYLTSIGWTLSKQFGSVRIDTGKVEVWRGHKDLIKYAEEIRKARENVAER
jgi:hypothetical protein